MEKLTLRTLRNKMVTLVMRNRIWAFIIINLVLLGTLMNQGCSPKSNPALEPSDSSHSSVRLDTLFYPTGENSQINRYQGLKLHGTQYSFWENGAIFSISGFFKGVKYYEAVYDSSGLLLLEWGEPVLWIDMGEEPKSMQWKPIELVGVDFPGFEETLSTLSLGIEGDELAVVPLYKYKDCYRTAIRYPRAEHKELGFKYLYRPSPNSPWHEYTKIYSFEVKKPEDN